MNEPMPAESESSVLPVSADAAKLEGLRREAHRWRRVCRLIMLLPVAAASPVMLWFLLDTFGFVQPMPNWMIRASLLLNAGLSLIGIPIYSWRKAVKAYHEQLGIEAVGFLVEGLPLRDTEFFAQKTLAEMLPRLQASDAHLLTPQHHEILNRVLNRRGYYRHGAQAAFVLAILKAYEQVGTLDDLPTVERLAQGKGHAKRNKEIQAAAQACLPYLRERSEQQETRQTLLRASGASPDGGGALLRPAAAADNAAPRELLRPAEPGA